MHDPKNFFEIRRVFGDPYTPNIVAHIISELMKEGEDLRDLGGYDGHAYVVEGSDRFCSLEGNKGVWVPTGADDISLVALYTHRVWDLERARKIASATAAPITLEDEAYKRSLWNLLLIRGEPKGKIKSLNSILYEPGAVLARVLFDLTLPKMALTCRYHTAAIDINVSPAEERAVVVGMQNAVSEYFVGLHQDPILSSE